MTLQDLSLPVTYQWGIGHALVFDAALAGRLAELHAMHGRPDCVAMPRQLADGRFMLVADILTAAAPGGYLHAMWEAADKAILLPAVEVMPLADVLALLPGE
jgi:hypothetical protein